MKTTPNSVYLRSETPGGIFYSHQGRGGPGDKPWPETARALLLYGRVSAAIRWPRARRFEPRAVPSVPCQTLCLVSSLQPLVLTKSAPLGQWLSLIGL